MCLWCFHFSNLFTFPPSLSNILNGSNLQTVDNDLALKIYIKARATPKVVAAFAERREFDKILIYSKQVTEICFPSITRVFIVHLVKFYYFSQ